jgi:hypothetical protein
MKACVELKRAASAALFLLSKVLGIKKPGTFSELFNTLT